jgi:hypothetical protein
MDDELIELILRIDEGLEELARERLMSLASRGFIGPGTTSMFLPVLLPFYCCSQAHEELCRRCGARGWTHGQHAPEDLRCIECDENLHESVKQQWRQWSLQE